MIKSLLHFYIATMTLHYGENISGSSKICIVIQEHLILLLPKNERTRFIALILAIRYLQPAYICSSVST